MFSSSNFYDDHHNPVSYNGYTLDHEHVVAEGGHHVLDISITKNVFFLLITAFLLLVVFSAVARGYKKKRWKSAKRNSIIL